MQEIIPAKIWTGNRNDVQDISLLYDLEIKAVVDLALEELPLQFPRDFYYARIPLVDGEGNDPKLLKLAIHTVVSLIQNEIPSLIVCSAGMSRSPAILSAALSILEKIPLEEILNKYFNQIPHDLSVSLFEEIRKINESSE